MTGVRARSAGTRALLSLLIAAIAALTVAATASAAPTWRIDAAANPTARPGSQLTYLVRIANVGDVAFPATVGGDAANCTPGSPPPSDPSLCYTVTATFPVGITPVSSTPMDGGLPCVVDGGTNSITCAVPGDQASGQIPANGGPVGKRTMLVTTTVDPAAAGTLTTTFDVAGAGGPRRTTVEPVTITGDTPEFDVTTFDGQVAADAEGTPYTQAAGHPYSASTAFEITSIDNPNPLIGTLWPVEPLKDVVVDLPPGFLGNPTVVDRCTLSDLANGSGTQSRSLCPPTSQIGTATVQANLGAGFGVENITIGPLPVFNLVPDDNVPARFGFIVAGSVVLLDATVRSEDDYGVTVVVRNSPEGVPVTGTQLTLWGVPADPSHDAQRACPGDVAPWEAGRSCRSGAPLRAFLRNPSVCTPDGEGLLTTAFVSSWVNPDEYVATAFESHLPPAFPFPEEDESGRVWGDPQGPTGCDRVPFDPTLTGTPGAGSKAGEPAGFSFDLSLPQTDEPSVVGQSDLKKAVVTLPQGVRVSPSSAGGLAGCSSGQIALDSADDPTCPDGSKIGSLTIDTPLLHEPLTGGIYLATPFDNPFDSLIAIYIVARGPGVTIKLPGHVSPDASKGGQLTATFDDNPQLPFSNLHLEFKSGPRAPLALPKRCGRYTTHAELTSWSGKTVSTESSFTVDQGCTGGFRPGFSAGTETGAAGKSSPFLLRLTRGDTDEELSGITLDMPRGLTGRIADVTLCGDGAAAAGTCTDASKVGNVTVGAGAGPNPFYITNGRAYLTGPYKGAPFGLSIVVPAVAGPFDLGLVVVRSAVFVDKHTAEVRVVSDPLPTQLQGIPLDVKDVRVDVDREGFWLNPTSCSEKTIRGTITSASGSSASVSDRFQAYDCGALPLRPRMTLQVGGRGRTQRGRTTPFNATLRQTPGQTALRTVRVTLPTTINARLTVINDACTRAEYEAGNCEDARTGSATAVTPLLRDPLRGGVYFVRNGNPLPDMFVRLRGQVDFDLVGRITIPGSKRLRTTFDLVPDVPVSSFALRLNGGREGSVGNAANLCSRRGRRARAELDFIGQNGKVLQVDQRLKIRGCRARRGRRGRRARRARGRRSGRR